MGFWDLGANDLRITRPNDSQYDMYSGYQGLFVYSLIHLSPTYTWHSNGLTLSYTDLLFPLCPGARDLEMQCQGQGQGNDVCGVSDGALTGKLDRLMLPWKQ